MKVSALAVAVTAALGLDSAATLKIKNALDVALAADKKGKDEGGLGPVEIEKKGKDKKGKDEFPDKDDKAKDEKEDKAEDADMDDMDAEDEDKDDEKAKDADPQPKESVTGGGSPAGNKGAEPAKDKKGMDAAAVDKKVADALQARDALHAARRDVEPVIGEVTYDSAAAVYKAALAKLDVATDGIDPSAFPALFKMAREKVEATKPRMASDAATVKSMATAIKGYDRLPAR